MLATGTAVDLGDAIANGIATIAVIISVIALFTADSRAKDANETAIDANKTSREARDIAEAAHQRTVKHYEHIESQDLERIQAEFKRLTTPHIQAVGNAIAENKLNPDRPNNKTVDISRINDLHGEIHNYMFIILQNANVTQAGHFMDVVREVGDAVEEYVEAYSSHVADRVEASHKSDTENPFTTALPSFVDEDKTGRLRATRENLTKTLLTYYEILFRLSYADDYREEMTQIPKIMEKLRRASSNPDNASPTDSPLD